ncbi:MAG: DUF2480 family protein [Ferruginibacter sp.]|nr:DUF2480 family protein [Ferruginibacter sp.]
MSEVFVNKVAESGIITIDLEEFYPKQAVAVFDMKDHLFMGLILKEKEFREALKNIDFTIYQNKNVALTCTADAIIPMWAYMLVVSYLQPYANEIVFGNEEFLHKTLFLKNLSTINSNDYTNQRVVIKGCGELPITELAYVEITKLLRPVAKSIMYGEPCSTVPIYKKPKTQEGN